MNTYEKIKELSKQKKISIRQLEMRFGYSNGYLAKWKNNTPNSDELVKLADYFNVSVDYLLGRETDNSAIIKPAEENFDDNFVENMEKEEDIRIIQRAARNMNDEDRKKAIDLWKIAFDKAFEDEK